VKFLLKYIFGFDKNVINIEKKEIASLLAYLLLYIGLITLSFYAFFHAIYLLTENIPVSSLVGLFFTYLLHNMYRLILSTSYKANEIKTNFQLWIYILTKGFLVLVLSIFISKSICTDVFSDDITNEIGDYKSEIIENYKLTLNKNFKDEIDDLKNEYKSEIEFSELVGKSVDEAYQLIFNERIDKVNKLKEKKLKAMNLSIEKSNFFMEKIKIVSSQPKHWLFSLLSVFIFLLPLYFYNSLPFFLNYQRSVIENNHYLILHNYNNFKTKYSSLLSSKAGKPVTVEEKFEDPPFNTVPKVNPLQYLEKGSLLNWIKKYHD
tara:strand:+ start:550 stop:1509 length:960 start_codon:yes stop_codon:yes gene_type:complete